MKLFGPFEKNFGEVHHVLLVKDKNTGKSRGFGYITMTDSMVIEKILSSKPIFINEHKIDCKIAIPKEFISEGKPEQKVPQFIKLIEDKDLTNNHHKDTEYFSAALGIKLPFHSLEHFRLWNRLLNQNVVNDMIEAGKKYYEYKKYLIHRNFHIIVPMKFGKHTIGVGNFEAVGLTSDVGNALSERNPEYDFILLWSYHYNENLYSVMLRTRNEGIDLATIASHYGGGGQPRASRFTWNRPIEELFKEWKKVLPKLMSQKKTSKRKLRTNRKKKSSKKSLSGSSSKSTSNSINENEN